MHSFWRRLTGRACLARKAGTWTVIPRTTPSQICGGEHTGRIWQTGTCTGERIARLEKRNGRAKLTARVVRLIRRGAQAGLTQKRMASRFGVTLTAIRMIALGKHWAHVV